MLSVNSKLVEKKNRLKGIRQCHDRNDSKSEHTNALTFVYKVQPTSFIASTLSLSSVSYPECFIIMRNFENLTQTRALFNPPFILLTSYSYSCFFGTLQQT